MIIILNVLVIDRRIKENESLDKLIKHYREDYGMIIFPPKENEVNPSFQIFCFDFRLALILEGIFKIKIDYDKEEPGDLFDFLVYAKENYFYEILMQNSNELNVYNLTKVERLD